MRAEPSWGLCKCERRLHHLVEDFYFEFSLSVGIVTHPQERQLGPYLSDKVLVLTRVEENIFIVRKSRHETGFLKWCNLALYPTDNCILKSLRCSHLAEQHFHVQRIGKKDPEDVSAENVTSARGK